MKKCLAVTLILTLLMAVPALAEVSVEGVQMDWNQDTADAFVQAGFDGDMYTITLKDGVKFQLLIPTGFEQRELTEEDTAQGVDLAFANQETGGSIKVMDTTLEAYDNLVEIAAARTEKNPGSMVQYALINGASVLITAVEEDDEANITVELGDHRFVQILFAPVSQNSKLLPFFMASIQF